MVVPVVLIAPDSSAIVRYGNQIPLRIIAIAGHHTHLVRLGYQTSHDIIASGYCRAVRIGDGGFISIRIIGIGCHISQRIGDPCFQSQDIIFRCGGAAFPIGIAGQIPGRVILVFLLSKIRILLTYDTPHCIIGTGDGVTLCVRFLYFIIILIVGISNGISLCILPFCQVVHGIVGEAGLISHSIGDGFDISDPVQLVRRYSAVGRRLAGYAPFAVVGNRLRIS